MPKGIEMPQATILAMQNARSDGQKPAEIAKNFNVSNFTVYKYTKAPKKAKELQGAAGVAASIRAETLRREKAEAAQKNSTGTYSGVLADLRAKRDAINSAIATIEALG